jgi:hypothetical protein
MKNILSVLVLFCTASMANPFPGMNQFPGQYPGQFPGGQIGGQQQEILGLANNLVGTTNRLLREARRIVSGRMSLQQRQALGRIEDLNRLSLQFRLVAQRALQGFNSNSEFYVLRELQQRLEQAAFQAQQNLRDLFRNEFIGGPQYPNPYPGQYPGQYPSQYPGQYPGQFPQPYPGQLPGQYPVQNPGYYPGQFPGGVVEGLMRQAEQIIRELRFRL